MALRPSDAADPIAAAIAKVGRRVRLQRALDAACVLGIAGVALAGVGVCLLKTGDPASARAVFVAAAAAPLLGLLIGALRPLPRLLLARLCDRAAQSDDLIASAWSFRGLTAAQHNAFMRACIGDATERARTLDAARGFALRAPRGLRELLAASLGVVLLSLLEIPVPVPQAPPPKVRAQLLHQDDIDAFREQVDEISLSAQLDAETRAAAEQVNELLEALAEGELDRLEALRELRRLERELQAEHGEQRDALDEALHELGSALGRGELIDSVAQAMREADTEAAARSFEQLARTLEDKTLRESQQRELERSLRRGARTDDELQQKLERKRRELERLLRKKQQEGQQSPRERRLLQKKKRELDKLRREHEQQQAGRRQLDRLRRRMDDAAQGLGQQNRSGASQQLKQASQEMAKLREKQLSKQQREELRKRLAQLREQISKQRKQQQQRAQQGGQGQQQQQGRAMRLSREQFARLSRGKGGKPGQQGQDGKDGDKDSKDMLLMPGQGDGKQQLLMPGGEQPGGNSVQMLSEEGRSQAGHGGRPQSGERATEMDAKHIDSQLTGAKGKGPSRSEIIADASSQGFALRSYESVHTEYQKHAESVLERDEVPGGYRFYVRRYFQLIRPREESP